MRYIVDHDLHIHSRLSLCSLCKEQTPERILRYAEENGFSTICLTDHFWDETVPGWFGDYDRLNFARISQSLPLPFSDKVRFLFGAETEINKDFVIGISPAVMDKLDFIVVPTTHMGIWHKGGTIRDEDFNSIQARAQLWSKRFDVILEADLPFHKVGIAHLACDLMSDIPENYLPIIRSITEEDMSQCFTKAAVKGAGIELNYCDILLMRQHDEIFRMFAIAKQCNCHFYFGSDAHKPAEFAGVKESFEYAVDRLGLTEKDKFRIGE